MLFAAERTQPWTILWQGYSTVCDIWDQWAGSLAAVKAKQMKTAPHKSMKKEQFAQLKS